MKLCLLQWLYVSILGETKRGKQTMSWSQLTKKSHACWKSRDLTYTLVNLIILKENLFGFKTNNNYIGQGILADLYLFFNCIFIVHTITDVPTFLHLAHHHPAPPFPLAITVFIFNCKDKCLILSMTHEHKSKTKEVMLRSILHRAFLEFLFVLLEPFLGEWCWSPHCHWLGAFNPWNVFSPGVATSHEATA